LVSTKGRGEPLQPERRVGICRQKTNRGSVEKKRRGGPTRGRGRDHKQERWWRAQRQRGRHEGGRTGLKSTKRTRGKREGIRAEINGGAKNEKGIIDK